MNLKYFFALTAFAINTAAFGQEKTNSTPLQISGSADVYYKYDFAEQQNIKTSFDNDQNSVSLGMLDLILKKTTGKSSFVGEFSFGSRGQYGSIPNGDGDELNSNNSTHIQNLYMSYAFTDRLSATAGYMSTFIGYEVITPTGNYNYSTSYLFTNGPFQNGGIKANYVISSKVAVMVGLFNDWNVYKDVNGVSHFGAQLALTPVEGWIANLNVLTGQVTGIPENGSIYDLTTTYQLNDAVKLGLNAADYSITNDKGGYSGLALYFQNAFNASISAGLRGEYFKSKSSSDGLTLSGVTPGESVFGLTLTANVKSGGLTFIPEVRLDKASSKQFLDKQLAPDKKAAQFSLAAVYAF